MFDEVKKSLGSVLSDIGIKDKHNFTLSIEGEEIPVLSGKVFKSMDNCADGCNATVILNDKLKEIVRPFGYQEAQVYLGGELVITGLIYDINPIITSEEKRCNLGIYNYSCDIIDSNHYPPYEFNFVTLEDLANELIGGLGIVSSFESNEGNEFFDRVCIDPQQTIFSFLNELANQRGVLITSNEKGEVLFIRANINSKPVETIKDVTDISARYNGRELFAVYRTSATSPSREQYTKKLKTKTVQRYKTVQTIKIAEAYDKYVPASRQITFSADNTHIDELSTAAEWQRSKRWAEALTISVPRIGWRPQGKDEIYRENTLITLINKDIWIEKAFDFIIKSVEYVLDSNGATCTLELVPPQSFTGEEIPDIFGNEEGLTNVLKSLGAEEWL